MWFPALRPLKFPLLDLLPFALLVSATVDLDPSADLDALGNNTLFAQWRPRYHFSAPAGWMNDPCGAVYDPHREMYHLMYQWHPNHVQWGKIVWGHAVSRDLVTWHDIRGWRDNTSVALAPSEEYDRLSVFTGTVQPVNIAGSDDGTLLAFYTSVRALPTNWQLPYIPGTESQSLATSTDGGQSWQKYEGNPVIEGTPDGWNITGLRDPFYKKWPEMDAVLGRKDASWYLVMGSGIKGVGPRIPLYAADSHDLTRWTFLGALWEPSANESFGDVRITGSYGFNFEVPNFFSLKDRAGRVHYYVAMGVEGGSIPGHPRWALWSEGQVSRRQNGSAEFSVLSSGVADWGNLYALTAFEDTKHDRRVQWGWSDEEMNNYGVRAQGYQGALGLPRELFVHETYNLVSNDSGEPSPVLAQRSANVLVQHANGTFSASTMGVRPLKDVVGALHQTAKKHVIRGGRFNNLSSELPHSKYFSISATLSNVQGPAGFVVRASADGREHTTVTYDPDAHTISVDRSKSSLIGRFANSTASGHYYAPLTKRGKGRAERVQREPIRLTVFVDNSLIEVFANDRFALTTRVYPTKGDAEGMALHGTGSAHFEDVCVHADIQSVWPGRPMNSSSHLVWDRPEMTGNYTWWSGW